MYYPKNQIVTGLYSDGKLAYKSSPDQVYSGPYWKTSQGKIFSGKTPQDTPIFELIELETLLDKTSVVSNKFIVRYKGYENSDPFDSSIILNNEVFINNISSDFSSQEYIDLKKVDPNVTTSLPYYLPNLPQDSDYQVGEFRRYFCKKVDELIYIEIDKKQHDLLENKDAKILFGYYQPFNIPWRLTGDKTYVGGVNFNMVKLAMFRQKLPMFDMYLKEDYTKYYK